MAQIAEDLLLLLLDNASAQPGLDQPRATACSPRAVLLDLAHACRIRPSIAGESGAPDGWWRLTGPGSTDPVARPAFDLLQRTAPEPGAAIAKLGKDVEDRLVGQLEQDRPDPASPVATASGSTAPTRGR